MASQGLGAPRGRAARFQYELPILVAVLLAAAQGVPRAAVAGRRPRCRLSGRHPELGRQGRLRAGSVGLVKRDDSSARVHSRYVRCLTDRGVGSRVVTIRLRVRRFFCGNPERSRRIFAEQVDGLTEPYRHCSPALKTVLTNLGLALGGRAGERTTGRWMPDGPERRCSVSSAICPKLRPVRCEPFASTSSRCGAAIATAPCS